MWKSDGTEADTVLVKDIYPSGPWEDSIVMANVDGVLFLIARDGVHGYELWKSDGTTEGTVLVRDIWPGSSSSWPEWLTVVNDRLFFSADDGTHGRELWAYTIQGDLDETTFLPIILKNY